MRLQSPGLLAALLPALVLLSGCSNSQASYPVSTYPMGERVQLGRLIYTVFETQWVTHIGEGPTARLPQQRFFLVRMSVVNSGSQDQIVPNVTLESDTGASSRELSNGDGIPQWMGFIRSVKPAEAAQGNVVFDVAPSHYKLRITDENGERAALIDIPLSFGAETPEVVAPGEAKKP